mmetsp:Transcript_4763/g.11507  ORF Transcript_4763/g.11507 Transcript_4763/m.11507 type:complete len:220 (+) Transcript_4763:1174-1833(+)
MVATAMRLPAAADLANNFTTSSAIAESKPVDGSSASRTRGSESNSIPMEQRFLSPPLMPRSVVSPTQVCAQVVRRMESMTACTELWSTPRSSAVKRKRSAGLNADWSTSSCGINAATLRQSDFDSSIPSKEMWPVTVPATSPMRALSSVVLPAPDGPMTACSDPPTHWHVMFSSKHRPCKLYPSWSALNFLGSAAPHSQSSSSSLAAISSRRGPARIQV